MQDWLQSYLVIVCRKLQYTLLPVLTVLSSDRMVCTRRNVPCLANDLTPLNSVHTTATKSRPTCNISSAYIKAYLTQNPSHFISSCRAMTYGRSLPRSCISPRHRLNACEHHPWTTPAALSVTASHFHLRKHPFFIAPYSSCMHISSVTRYVAVSVLSRTMKVPYRRRCLNSSLLPSVVTACNASVAGVLGH